MLQKLAKVEDLIELFPHGSYVGWSGLRVSGIPSKQLDLNWLDKISLN
jgi:acetyl-CoA hydrolase